LIGTRAQNTDEPGRWGNARVEPKGNAIVDHEAGRRVAAKIDPLMAAFNAVALMAMNPQATGQSYLRSNELLVL
jgi:phage terminase large subunit-like protein